MKKVSINDVASTSGVSRSTVSKVFNGYADVSPKTRKKVLKVADKLGYSPNAAARSLSSKTLRTVALVLNNINVTRGVTRPLEILKGVLTYFDQTDCEFVFYATDSKKQKEKSLRRFIQEHNISGLLIHGLDISEPYYEELKTINFPIVTIDMHFDNPNLGTVSVDDRKAAFDATTTLLDKGYRKLLCLNGSLSAQVTEERSEGFVKAYRQYVENAEDYILYADFDETTAYRIISQELKRGREFDGLFAASDLMAIGAMRALEDYGLRVPDDVGIIGFDDIILTSYTKPTLSTVRQDATDLGMMAAQLLDDVMLHKTGAHHRILPHSIIVRDSI